MNFVVYADKRTGSSFFMECLNSHPDVMCYDEMFMIRGGLKKRRGQFLYKYKKSESKKKNYGINDYLDFLYSDKEKSSGFRLMYPQDDYFKVMPFIKKRDLPVIHLIRKNTLKMVMSKKTKGIFKPTKSYYNPDSLIADIKNHKRKERLARKQLKGYDKKITVYYEDMIGRSEGEKGDVKKFGAFNLKSNMTTYLDEKISIDICKFLNIEERELFCNVTKKNSNNVWDYIQNEKEVKKALKDNGYEDML